MADNFDRSLEQCIFYIPIVLGKTASFGGDIEGLKAVSQRGPVQSP